MSLIECGLSQQRLNMTYLPFTPYSVDFIPSFNIENCRAITFLAALLSSFPVFIRSLRCIGFRFLTVVQQTFQISSKTLCITCIAKLFGLARLSPHQSFYIASAQTLNNVTLMKFRNCAFLLYRYHPFTQLKTPF